MFYKSLDRVVLLTYLQKKLYFFNEDRFWNK